MKESHGLLAPTSRRESRLGHPCSAGPTHHLSISSHRLQRLRRVCAEILYIFQANVEAHDAMAVIWTVFCGVEIVSDRQAGYARPAISDLEQLQGIHKKQNLLLAKFALEDDGEKPSRPGEVALPEFMAGARGKRRSHHQFDLGPLREPLRQFQSGLLKRFQAHG